MTWYGFGTINHMIPKQCWYDGQGYHIMLVVYYFTGLLAINGIFYLTPPFSNLFLTNQGILTFKNRSIFTKAHQKPHLELIALLLVWITFTPSLVMMKRLMQRVTQMGINTKYYHITLRQLTSQTTLTKKEHPTLITNILGLKLCYLILSVKN